MAPYDREALRRAVRMRNIERLEAVLATVKENRLSEDLHREVREARRLLEILRRMNTIKASLQELKQTMLAEMTNQASPHAITVTIMRAVMVVLAVPESRLQEWSAIKAEIGGTTRKHFAFIKRMVGINSATIAVAHAKRAQQMLSRFNLDLERVSGISQPLGLFYSWLLTITDEVISIDAAGADE